MGTLTFLFAVTAFSMAAPQQAQAQATCTVNWGTVAYRSTNNTYVMSEGTNPAVLAACDPRYPNVDSGPVSPTSGSSSGGGTWSAVANLADNTLTYSPNARWVGPDTYTMYFCNDPGCTAAGRLIATVNITVAPPPMSLTASIPGGTVAAAYSQTLTANGGASPYTFSVVSGSLPPGLSLGTVNSPTTSSSTVVLSGTPTAGGAFNFTIRATDNSIGTGPVTIDQSYTMTIGQPTVLVTTASVPNGAQNSAYASTTLSATGGTAPYTWSVLTGSLPTGLTLSSGGVLSGTPTQGGSFNFTARAQDSSTGTGPYIGTRAYSFNIVAVTPVANPVSVTVPYASVNNPVPLNITGGTPTSVGIGTQATNGVASVSGTTISYTPVPGYGGTDTFTYTATNASGPSAPATVTVTVSPPTITLNPATLANGKRTVSYSQSLSGGGGVGPYIYTHAGGTLPPGLNLNNITGQLSGTPATNGTYNFTIRVEDASSYGTGAPFFTTRAYTVSIVEPTPPIAGAISATVSYGSNNNPITLNLSGGAATSVAIATNATNGAAFASGTSVIYTPAPGYSGPDSFTYTATNADGTSAPATVSVTVNPQPPTVSAVSTTVAFNSFNNPVTLILGGGTATSIVTPILPTNGVVTVTGTSVTYTPDPGYFGSDSFTYVAINAGGASAPATVSVTVNPAPPVAGPVTTTVAYGSSNNAMPLNLSGGSAASVATPILPTNGTVSVTGTAISYTPNPGYFGPDSFTYTATNAAGTSAPATVSITVNPQPPTAVALDIEFEQDSANHFVAGVFNGGAPTSVAVVNPVANGSVMVFSLGFIYTPAAGFFGPDSFTYTATNAGGTSAPATVTITVLQTLPVADAVSEGVAFNATNAPIALSISGGVADSVATPTLPTHGTVSVTGATVTYTPNTNYAGSDSFTYTATNSRGTSAPATVEVYVMPPPAPVAGPVSAGIAANTVDNPIPLALSGGVTLGVAVPTPPQHGTTTITGTSITYTPTSGYSGADSFTYTAANPGGTSAPALVTVTVAAPTLTLSTIGLTGEVGVPYSATINAALGTAPYSFALTSGSDPLPTGLNLSTGGVLSGTPSSAGTYNLEVEATDIYGATGTRTYALAISAPTIALSPASGALPGVEGGASYSQTFTASGGFGAKTFAVTAGALPPGLNLSPTGEITGAATASGTFNFTVTATDSAVPTAFTGAAAYSITVTAPNIVVSPANLPMATTAAAYSETVTATGGYGPYVFSVTPGGLPPGLTLSAGGLISGAPTASGTYNFTIRATDGFAFTGDRFYTLVVSDPVISITSPASGALPGVEAGSAYSQSFTSTGGQAPRTWAITAGALPAGLNLSAGGEISGTPTVSGTFNFTVTASDSSPAPGPFTGSAAYSLTVTAPTIVVSPASLPDAQTATAYSQTVTASGGIGGYSYAITGGALPNGLTLSAGGVISGTTAAAGAYGFTVTATDSLGFTGDQVYTVTIADPVISITAPAAGVLPGVQAGDSYSQTFTATGGQTPRTFAVTAGALPAGLSLSVQGVLSGMPTVSGTFNFTVTASDGSPAPGPFTAAQAYSLTVSAPTITVSPTSLPAATTAGAYNQTLTATGGIGAHSFAVTSGALPAGLTLDPSGLLSGAPGVSGSFNFTVTATDSLGFTGSRVYALAVDDPVVTVTGPAPGALPGATGGVAYNQTFTAAGGQGAHSFAVVAGALPTGLTLSPDGLLSGTPTASGTFNVSITASDSSPAPGPFTSAPMAYSLTVTAPAITVSPTSLPDATTAVNYSEAVVATGGVGGHTYAVTAGAPPTGLTLNAASGVLSGVPIASGAFNFTVTATDSLGFTGTHAYTLTVDDPVVTITSPTAGALPDATGTIVYSQTFTATGGQGAHSFAVVAGTLPPGLTLTSTGLLSGTPTTSGSFSFSIAAADSSPAPGPFSSAPVAYSLVVAIPPAPTVSDRSGVAVGYNSAGEDIDLSASISGVHNAIAVASPPQNGTASVVGNTIRYVPNADYYGPDSFTFTATGPGGTSAPATVSLTVATPPPPVIDPPSEPVVVPPSTGAPGPITVSLGALSTGVIDGFRITVTSVHGTAEIVESVTATASAARSAAPAAAGDYELVYTPAANFMGTDTVTVVAEGPGGDSAPVTFTFQVAGKAPDLSGQSASNQSVTFTPTTTLVGGPFEGLRITRAPAFGTATVNGLQIVFTPGAANGGSTSLDYVIDLPFGSSAAGRIDLVSNLIPGIEALTAETVQGVPVTVRISNAAGGPFTGASVVSVGPTTAGTATIAGTGGVYDLTFTPTGAFAGEAVVRYTLTNAFGTSEGTLTVTVEARPDPGLDPEVRGVAGSQVTAAKRFADAQINNFQRRLQALRDGTNASSNGLSLNLGFGGQSDLDNDPRQALRRQLGQQSSRLDPGALDDGRDREMLGLDLWAGRTPTGTETAASSLPNGDRLNVAPSRQGGEGGHSVGFWTAGSIDWGRQDAEGQRDNRFTTQGVSAGLDVRVSDQLIVGGGLGYGEDRTKIGDNGSLTEGSALTGALYASWRPAEALYIDGVIGFADLDFDSRRWVSGLGGQPSGYAEGRRSGDLRFASAAFGRMIRREGWTSDLYARLDAREMTLDGFTETGGGLSALAWDALDQSSLSANLGASFRWSVDSRRYGRIMPSARLEWSHELEDLGLQGVRYADWAASPTYLVPLDAWSRNAINLDLGVEWSLTDRLMFSLGYRAMLGDASSSQGGQIGLKYGW